MVYGIASNQIESQVIAFVDQFDITFPVLLDHDGSVQEKYRMQQAFPSAAYPQDWIIDANGHVIYQNNGFEIDAIKTVLDNEME